MYVMLTSFVMMTPTWFHAATSINIDVNIERVIMYMTLA